MFRNIFILITLYLLGGQTLMAQVMDKKELTPEEQRVILHKGTEKPFSGQYYKFNGKGTYVCKQCGAPLFRSTDKFDAGCGWPSFDDAIPGAVKRQLDADGRRTEIVCARCGGHLGHVFMGEGFTPKNTRHCVNSISMRFIPEGSESTASDQPSATVAKPKTETAIYAGGCFWGVEYMMEKIPGVLSVEAGYTGGHTKNPTYEEVCSHMTGHAEAVRVVFDPAVVSYETLTKLFLEIHDPTQTDGQGPDKGDQYRSEIFYASPQQQETAQMLINQLKAKGYRVVTRLTPATTFWPAEDYHQNYYNRKGLLPYCHKYTKRF